MGKGGKGTEKGTGRGRNKIIVFCQYFVKKTPILASREISPYCAAAYIHKHSSIVTVTVTVTVIEKIF